MLGKRDQKKIGNNTWLIRRDAETVALRLHSTDILTFKLDGTVTIKTGGWQTVTTKARINEHVPDGFGLGQTKGVWHWYMNGERVKEFCDGDVIESAGQDVPALLVERVA